MGRVLQAVNDIRVYQSFSGQEFSLLLDHVAGKGLFDMSTPPPRPYPPRWGTWPAAFPPGATIFQTPDQVTLDQLIPLVREYAIAQRWLYLEGLEDTARGFFHERLTLDLRRWCGAPGKIVADKFNYPGEAWWIEPDECLLIATALEDIQAEPGASRTFDAEWAAVVREQCPAEFRRYAELNGFLIT